MKEVGFTHLACFGACNYERKLAALEVLKKSLFHRAFAGEL